MPVLFQDGLNVQGSFQHQGGPFVVQSGSIAGTAISPTTPVPGSSTVHRHESRFAINGAIAAQEIFSGPMLNDSTLDRVEVILGTPVTSTDTVTVDLQRWNGSAWATVLTSTLQWTDADPAMTKKMGSISSAALLVNQSLKWVITRTGTSGANLFGVLRRSENGLS